MLISELFDAICWEISVESGSTDFLLVADITDEWIIFCVFEHRFSMLDGLFIHCPWVAAARPARVFSFAPRIKNIGKQRLYPTFLTCSPKTGPFERRICSLNVHENEENRECASHGLAKSRLFGSFRSNAAGAKVSELCRKHGMSDATFYKWKARYGGLQISDVRRLKDLESENGKLKKLLAETMLDNAGLKGLLAKNF